MRKLLALAALAVATTGCVPAPYHGPTTPFGYPAGSMRGPGVRLQPAAQPFGRWDNVMMLGVGTTVQVLTMDGGLASGEVIAADVRRLRLKVAAGEVDLAFGDVMRVDRVEAAGSTTRKAARGAAIGAGAVGVIGLIVGRVPPPRMFAAGGIVGAYNELQSTAMIGGPATIYLASAVAQRRPDAGQWTPGREPQ